MGHRLVALTRPLALHVFIVLAAVNAAGQTPPKPAAANPKGWAPPRTPWGDPDLQGTFTNRDENGIPLERPSQFEGRQIDDVKAAELTELIQQRQKFAVTLAPTLGGAETGAGPTHWFEYYNANNSRPWLIVEPRDGKVPPRAPEADTRAAAAAETRRGRGEADSYEDRSLYDRCITRGLPGSMMPTIYGMAYQIVQAPGYAAIRYEMIHEARIIPLDGRLHVGQGVRTYMGDARGHWEGNTLVVETTNFNGRAGADNGYPSPEQGSSSKLRITERFKPVAPNTLEWSVTLDDPATWTRSWTFAMNLTRDQGQVFEYACHEGNYGLANILSAARAEDQSGKASAR
jgi:hypothetical protein